MSRWFRKLVRLYIIQTAGARELPEWLTGQDARAEKTSR